jgi:protein-disulfide isomerase
MAREVEDEYIQTGQVQLIYVDFVVHEDALLAHEAAHCAGEQDAYWEYHDVLFENQSTVEFTAENLKGFAEELGLDTEAFGECLDGNRFRGFVLAQTQRASEIGLQGTPTFLVNDEVIPGLPDYSQLQEIIEQELTQIEQEQTVTPTP